jgi:chromate transporter
MTNSSTISENIDSTHAPTFRDAAAYWIKLGFISFGGPAGQIAMMQTECVDKRRWIGQGAFLRGLNYAMMLPGPEAQQLAAYIGWRLHGVKGAVFAGTMFVLPGMILMIALAWIAAKYGDQGAVAAILDGIKPVVVAIVIAAVYRIGSKTCKGPAALGLAIGAFAALQFGGVPFPVVVLGAGLIGVIVAKFMPNALAHGHGPDAAAEILGQTANGSGLGNFIKTSLIFAALWAGPSALMIALFGVQPFLDVIKLFTTAAFVTFGGAYAVLPYVADAGVNTYGWLTGAEMIDGLALAETTPGPLILVTVYVGFFAGWSSGGGWMGVLTALVTAYVTFLPSLYLIIAGAPYVESIQRFAWARNALSAITAAVVGVILGLGIFLGRAAFIDSSGSIAWIDVTAAGVALALLVSGRVGIPLMVALGALFGLARFFIF